MCLACKVPAFLVARCGRRPRVPGSAHVRMETCPLNKSRPSNASPPASVLGLAQPSALRRSLRRCFCSCFCCRRLAGSACAFGGTGAGGSVAARWLATAAIGSAWNCGCASTCQHTSFIHDQRTLHAATDHATDSTFASTFAAQQNFRARAARRHTGGKAERR